MIGKLTGIVDSVGEDWVILDVGGVGYLVYASGRTLGQLQTMRGPASLLVETRMREEQITLYGFLDAVERDWFRMLTQVQGVGARVGLALLTALAPDEIAHSIAAEDRRNLTRAEGVGPKLAGRIVNELRDRVAGLTFASPPPRAAALAAGAPVGAAGGDIARDAVSALVNLGYGRTDAYSAVAHAVQAAGEGATLEALVRAGLKELSA